MMLLQTSEEIGDAALLPARRSVRGVAEFNKRAAVLISLSSGIAICDIACELCVNRFIAHKVDRRNEDCSRDQGDSKVL